MVMMMEAFAGNAVHSNQVIEDVHSVASVPKDTRRDSSELVSSGVGEPEAGRRCFTRYSWRSWTSTRPSYNPKLISIWSPQESDPLPTSAITSNRFVFTRRGLNRSWNPLQ